MARDVLLAHPVFYEYLKTNTDDRKFQLGEVIIQNGKLIVLYSRNLTDAQKRCTVTEKDTLSIIKTLKLFRTILLGQILRIYTDIKTLHVEL